MAKLDEELEELKKENADLPNQFKQIEDHSVRTEQELRRRELEYQEKEKQLWEIDKKKASEEKKNRRGKNIQLADLSKATKNKKGLFNSIARKPGRKTMAPETISNELLDEQEMPDDHFDN